jgi:hypothetical protein
VGKHRQLDASGFPKPFAQSLKKTTITASRLSLTRSAITLRSSYPGQIELGSMLWMAQGLLTVFSLLRSDLRPAPPFTTSPQSQRRTHSEFLAEALTHWFAQTHLGVDVLFSVERHPAKATMAPAGAAPPKAFPIGYRNPRRNTGIKSAPDFVGLGGGKAHVLEAKGRANFGYGVAPGTITAARNKALFQVCRVATVDGLTPATRTACIFCFESGYLTGLAVDPGPTEHFDLGLDRVALLRNYYRLVLDPLFADAATNGPDGFVGVNFAPGWRLSVDRQVLELARRLETRDSAERLLDALSARRGDLIAPSGDDSGVSLGPDGIKLEGPPDFDLQRLFKRKG